MQRALIRIVAGPLCLVALHVIGAVEAIAREEAIRIERLDAAQVDHFTLDRAIEMTGFAC